MLSEIAPLKANKSFGKFDTFLAPVYMLHNDFKEKETKQGVGLVLNSVYNINSKSSMKFEMEYSSEPSKNLFHTYFGKLKDNTSYVVSYLLNF